MSKHVERVLVWPQVRGNRCSGAGSVMWLPDDGGCVCVSACAHERNCMGVPACVHEQVCEHATACMTASAHDCLYWIVCMCLFMCMDALVCM